MGNLNDEHRNAIGAELDRVIAQDKVDDKVAADYVRFVKEVPDDAWKAEPLQPHLDRLFTRVVEKFQDQNRYLQQFFPAARRLIPVVPPGRTASLLQPLFSQAAALPDVYPMLHGQMEEEWPEENEQTGSYGAQQIFERANQFIEQQASAANASNIVRSMAHLVVSGRVGKSNLDSVAEAVCRVWPHSPNVLQDCLKYVVNNLNPEQIIQLIKQTGQDEQQATDFLKKALPEIVASLDFEQRQNTLMRLLNEQPILLEEEPDGGLGIWIDVQDGEQSEIMEAALTNEGLNDKQIERIFQQSIRVAERVHLEFFIKVLPSLFSRSELTRTREKIFESVGSITALASNADQRANLTLALIEALPNVADQETLARLAEWVRDNGGQAALEQAKEVLQKLDTESLAILVKKFPDSRRLKGVLDSHQSSSSEKEVVHG